jgi:hypothetical protein
MTTKFSIKICIFAKIKFKIITEYIKLVAKYDKMGKRKRKWKKNRYKKTIFEQEKINTAMELSQVHIYRMTHIENIPHILQHGITHKNSSNANPDYVTIGDTSLISTRATKNVTITNGNRSQNCSSIVLGDFIPFYFGVRMPMLYVMQHGGNCVEKPTPPKDIVYLVCKVTDIMQSGITYYFSDGHATDFLSLFYDSSKINELPNIIDWTAVKSTYWSGENLPLRPKKQAEFLIADDIPAQYLCGFGCYNEKAKQKLTDLGIESDKIKIIPNAYY